MHRGRSEEGQSRTQDRLDRTSTWAVHTSSGPPAERGQNRLRDFCDGGEPERSVRIAGASGSKPSEFRNRVHYVVASGGTGKSHLAQAIGQAAILQGHKVIYRETHVLLEELAEAMLDGTRKQYMESISTVTLLIIDDFGMRKLPQTAAEDLLEIVMRRYERASTLLTSNRPVEDWGKLLSDVAAIGSMLDRLLHHGHILKCGPRSWRTRTAPAQ
jgi:DNA replication protein DnaC